MITPTARMSHLSCFYLATLDARIREMQAQGIDVIRMDVGSPDLPPPQHIIDALAGSAAKPDRHGYQPHNAKRELREAWASMYLREYGVEIDPDHEIMPLLGSKEGIFNLTQAFIQPEDIALVPDPGYVTYSRAALFAGGQVYNMPLLADHQYLPDLSAIPKDVLQKAKLMWLNYPNNPTAAIANLDYFKRVVDLALEYEILICHDAAYSLVTFDGEKPLSLLQVPNARQVAVEFNTLSKSHNMAGWRVGVVVGEENSIRTLYRLKTNVDSGHFLAIMEAAVVALTGDQSWIHTRNQVYEHRRDVLIEGLISLGLIPQVSQASIYVWARVPIVWSSQDFTMAALENAHISMTPGNFFGSHGEGYMRIALTATDERIRLAMERLKEWMEDDPTFSHRR